MSMTSDEIRTKLAEPFHSSEIEWRVSTVFQGDKQGIAVPYVTNRAIQQRLDEVVGINLWYNEFRPWKNDAQLCGIAIYFAEQDIWIVKWDGSDNSKVEPVKGGISDAMKRAAVQWGVGRYLYQMDTVFVDLDDKKRIKKESYATLNQAHDVLVKKVQSGQSAESGRPVPSGPADRQPMQQAQQKPQELRFRVAAAQTIQNPNGSQHMAIQLLDLSKAQAEPSVPVFFRGADPKIRQGAVLGRVAIEPQAQNGQTYYVLTNYLVEQQGNQAA